LNGSGTRNSENLLADSEEGDKVKYFLNYGKNFLTSYDFHANTDSSNPIDGKKTHFNEFVKQSKLFIIKNELVELFLKEIKKGAGPKTIPFNEKNKLPQPVLRLPFDKIWIEPFNEINQFIYPKLNITWLGSLVEDLGGNFFHVTTTFSHKEIVHAFPVKIHKYNRKTVMFQGKPEEICMMGTSIPILEIISKSIGLKYTQEDILEIVGEQVISGSIKTTNPLLGLNLFTKTVFDLMTWIIQYINTSNSEIVYIGASKEYYKKKKGNKIQIPPAYVIYLRNRIVKPGFLFNGKKFSSNYVFDIRGHFRTFKNKRYTKMQGKTIWINPFKKGRGKYVKKRYVITRSDLWNQLEEHRKEEKKPF